jgi:hypothetical protein
MLRPPDRLLRVQPIDREIVVGVGEPGSGLAGARRLAGILVGLPGHPRDLVKLGRKRRESRVAILRQKAGAELPLAQPRTGHSFAGGDRRHRRLLCVSALPHPNWSGMLNSINDDRGHIVQERGAPEPMSGAKLNAQPVPLAAQRR